MKNRLLIALFCAITLGSTLFGTDSSEKKHVNIEEPNLSFDETLKEQHKQKEQCEEILKAIKEGSFRGDIRKITSKRRTLNTYQATPEKDSYPVFYMQLDHQDPHNQKVHCFFEDGSENLIKNVKISDDDCRKCHPKIIELGLLQHYGKK